MSNLISPDEALRLVLEETKSLPPGPLRIAEALGTVLAEPIHADRDSPPFDRAMMDGYAVVSSDADLTLPVIGEAAAGKPFPGELSAGRAIEIMTGAPCPAGCDAVVPQEDSFREGNRVDLPETIKPGQNIARRGIECRSGDQVLAAGQVITPLALAVLASVGRAEVSVIRRPRIAIITTGNELISADAAPEAAQIRDSNGPMLGAMAKQLGLNEIAIDHAQDNFDSLTRTVESHLDRDIIILSGGVSMGKYDLVPSLLESLGAKTIFHKVAQRPGKPLLFATRSCGTAAPGCDSQLFFGLPGNPLSCHLCFHRYIRAAVKKMMGLPPIDPPSTGYLTEPYSNNSPRTVFQLARANWDNETSRWLLTPLRGKGSADIFKAADANVLIRFDSQPEKYEIIESLEFELLG